MRRRRYNRRRAEPTVLDDTVNDSSMDAAFAEIVAKRLRTHLFDLRMFKAMEHCFLPDHLAVDDLDKSMLNESIEERHAIQGFRTVFHRMNDWTKTARELRFVTGNSDFLLDDMPDMLRSLNARDLGRLKRGLTMWTPESWLSARERVPLELGLKIRRFAGGKRGREVLIQLRNDLVVAYGPLHEMWLGKSTEFMRQWRRANNLPRKLHQPKQERYEWDDEPEAL